MPTTPPSPNSIPDALDHIFAESDDTGKAEDRTFFLTIPSPATLTKREGELYESGEYPIRLARHLPCHETFADYLIERSLEAWTRFRG